MTENHLNSFRKYLTITHRYPPNNEQAATEKVIVQAELLADTWAVEFN